MTARDKIIQAAQEHGWEVGMPTGNYLRIRKPVPMIERRDQHEVTVIFKDDKSVGMAYLGPDYRPKPLPHAPAVVDHLRLFGRRT